MVSLKCVYLSLPLRPASAITIPISIPYCQYNGCRCLCDARSQGISSHGIDLFLLEYSSSSLDGIKYSSYHIQCGCKCIFCSHAGIIPATKYIFLVNYKHMGFLWCWLHFVCKIYVIYLSIFFRVASLASYVPRMVLLANHEGNHWCHCPLIWKWAFRQRNISILMVYQRVGTKE